jgi:hypothetical protein
MIVGGWTAARLDSLSPDSLERASAPFAEQSAAEELVHALRAYPRYYATVRPRTLAVDTNSAIKQALQRGLIRLRALYPEARFPTVYFVIGNLYTGGITARSGMLIGTEQYASGHDTPLDELPAWAQAVFPAHDFESLVGIVVHEAVHTQQQAGPEGQHDTLLRHALVEGIAGAYYARAADKRAALRELLELRDPVAVLRASGYAP